MANGVTETGRFVINDALDELGNLAIGTDGVGLIYTNGEHYYAIPADAPPVDDHPPGPPGKSRYHRHSFGG